MARFLLLVLCALGTVWLLVGASFSTSVGPYNVELKELETCDDEITGQVHSGSKISNVGDGKFTVTTHIFHYKYHWMNTLRWICISGNWRIQASVRRVYCEDLLKMAKDLVYSLFQSDGVTVNKCPIPKGVLERYEQTDEEKSREGDRWSYP